MSLHWNTVRRKREECPEIGAFLNDLWAVCEKHKLALSHEDRQGGFEIVKISDAHRVWLMDASNNTEEEEEDEEEKDE